MSLIHFAPHGVARSFFRIHDNSLFVLQWKETSLLSADRDDPSSVLTGAARHIPGRSSCLSSPETLVRVDSSLGEEYLPLSYNGGSSWNSSFCLHPCGRNCSGYSSLIGRYLIVVFHEFRDFLPASCSIQKGKFHPNSVMAHIRIFGGPLEPARHRTVLGNIAI